MPRLKLIRTTLRILLISSILALQAANQAAGDDFDIPIKGSEWLTPACLVTAKKAYSDYEKDHQKQKALFDSETKEAEIFTKEIETVKNFLENNPKVKTALKNLDEQYRNDEISSDSYDTQWKAMLAPITAGFNNIPGYTKCNDLAGLVSCALVKEGWNHEVFFVSGVIVISTTNISLSTPEEDKNIIQDATDTINDLNSKNYANLMANGRAQVIGEKIEACNIEFASTFDQDPTDAKIKNCVANAKAYSVEIEKKDKKHIAEVTSGLFAIVKNPGHPFRAHTQNAYRNMAIPIDGQYNGVPRGIQTGGDVVPSAVPEKTSWDDFALATVRSNQSCLSEKAIKMRADIKQSDADFQRQKRALYKEICNVQSNGQAIAHAITLSKSTKATLIRIKNQLGTNEFDEAIKKLDETPDASWTQNYCNEIEDAQGNTKAGVHENTSGTAIDASEQSVNLR